MPLGDPEEHQAVSPLRRPRAGLRKNEIEDDAEKLDSGRAPPLAAPKASSQESERAEYLTDFK